MTKLWSDVAASSAFQALTPEEQEEARQQYFDEVVAPQVPEEDLGFARGQFDEDTYVSASGGPTTRGGRRNLAPPENPLPQDPRIAGALQPDDPSLGRALVRLPGNTALSAKAALKGNVAGIQQGWADTVANREAEVARRYESGELRPANPTGERRWMSPEEIAQDLASRAGPGASERAGEAELEQGRAVRATRRAQAEAQAAIPADAGPIERNVQSGLSSAAITVPIVTLGAAVPGGQAPALVALGGMAAASRYGELRAAGIDEGPAAISAAALGGLQSLTEATPLGALAKKSPFMHKAMEFLVQDLLGENVSSLAQIADDYRLQLRDDVTMGDIQRSLGETTAQTVVGAGAQLSVSGLMDAVIAKANQRAAAREPNIQPLGAEAIQAGATAPQADLTNYTPPDSLSAQVGLTPIVVPNVSPDKRAEVAQEFGFDQMQESPHVGPTDGAPAVPQAGGPSAGADLAGGVVAPGSVPAVGGQPVAAGAPVGDRQEAGPVPGEAGEQAAPLKQWFGRAGDGYKTEGDAQQALPGRQRMHPELAWKIEPMPSGKYRLAGYGARTLSAAEQATVAPKVEQQVPVAHDGDYIAFPPASGTRGVPRADMPQVKAEHRGALVNFLNARGVQHEQQEVPSSELKATQAEYSPAKVDQAKAFTGGDRSILVSSDGHIVDGHHQWIAKLDEGAPVKVIRLNAPIDKLLPLVREFPSSTSSGESNVTQTPEAVQTEAQGPQAPGGVAAPGAIAASAPAAQTELRGPELEGLKLAPQAPASVVDGMDTQLRRQSDVEIEQVSQKNMSAGHRVASAIARVFGKTLTVVKQRSGDPKRFPNGFINGYGGKHIFIADNTEDAPLSVAMHEIYHSIPAEQRVKLNQALLALTHQDKHGDFSDEYSVALEDVEEELPAYMVQAISKRDDFWEQLREKMGNKEFGQVARVIIDKLNELLTGFKSDYGDEFLQKYVKDIARARDLLTDAYAAAQRGDEVKSEEAEAVMSNRRQQIGDFEASVEKDGSITVNGDVEQIRELLPDDVIGRATNGGMKFRNSDAARVRAALEGRKVAYGRGGEVTERLPMKDGKYLGAPEKFDTPAKIPTLRKWLKQLALEGEPGRMWYENSSEDVLRMVGGSVQEARKFAALLAIYSPQAKVDTNATFGLRAWAQHKAGQTINVKTRVMDQKATEALSDVDAFWSGEKTGNFVTNLLRRIDPSLAQGATIDMWMMRAAQYATDAPGATQYSFMENEVNRLAKELGWEPQQVQAAIWVAMKSRMENRDIVKRTEAKSEKRGWIRFETRDGKKVRKILNKEAHRNNWLATASAHTPTEKDTAKAKFDFGDGLRRHIGQVSFEARPGRSTGVLPGAHDAPYALQLQFQQDIQKALYDKDGVDLLAQKLGLLIDSEVIAPGVWMGEISPSTQTSVAMAPGKGDEGKTVDPAQAKNLNVYAAVLGLLSRQEGVGWHRPFPVRSKAESNGVQIDIGRPLNPREVSDLSAAIGRWMVHNGYVDWQDKFAFISSPKGIRLVNFGVVSNAQLQKELIEVAEGVLPDGHVDLFKSDGDMPTNDWKENPNGQAYVQRIRAAGRSDVLDWARDVLAPRVQDVFERYSREQGWGEAGELRFSNRAAAAAGEEGVQDAGGVRGSAGSVAGDRGPYSEPGKRGETLEGLPSRIEVDGQVLEFAGFKPAQEAAREYMKRADLPYHPPRTYAKIDRKRARRIAESFTMLIHDPSNPEVKLAYQMMIKETLAQYREILGTGLQMEFIRGDDPYGNPRNAILDVVENNHLWVFPTSAGFGSDATFDASENPLLAETEFKISGETALANDIFRVVHDYFGHVKEGVGFRAEGEENAWRSHSSMYSPLARRAMTTETRAQNSWVNFGPNAEKNRFASGADTVYADQKMALMPKWVSEEGAADELVFSNRGPTFFSSLTRAAEQLKLTKASEAQWMASLRNQHGVKEEEIQWTGLHDWLMSLGRQATKQEVVDFLRANELQVEEVLKGSAAARADERQQHDDLVVRMTAAGFSPESEEGRLRAVDSNDGTRRWIRGRDGVLREEDGTTLPPDIEKMAEEIHQLRQFLEDDDEINATRYHKYTTPGGEKYTELLLTLPEKKPVVARADFIAKMKEKYGRDDWYKGATEGELLAFESVRNDAIKEREKSSYISSHWDEPNILTHVRFDERTDADGKRVLFIQEIQSDWHQQGRQRGYKDDERRFSEEEIEAGRQRLRRSTYGEEEIARMTPMQIVQFGNSYNVSNPVPDAPLKTTWQEFAFKRMLRWAAENDFDRIAWTTGEMQAERYDLSKHIDRVTVTQVIGNDNVVLRAYKGGNVVISKSDIGLDEIDDVVGKEVAEKLIKQYQRDGKAEVSGLDLKVGGEGMKGFYDDILPKFVNKYTKKWGGRVSTTKVSVKNPSPYSIEYPAPASVHSVDITMPMRDAALSGQPVFSNRVQRDEPKQTDTSAFRRWFGDSKVVDENGEPLVLYRGVIGSSKTGISDAAINGEPREGYATFLTNEPAVAASYGMPDFNFNETGALVPFYVKGDELIEFPTTKDGGFDKFAFDRRAVRLKPGQVLVARGVYDYGPRASIEIDPERRYSYRSDVYAVGRGTQMKSAIGIVASNRQAATVRRPWLFERDKLGNFRFAAGARAYRLVADVANAVLAKVKLKPISSELGRAMRRMHAEIAAAKEKAAVVAGKLGTLSAEERELISDVIERELRTGVTPPEKILAIAANMQHIMSEQTKQLVDLGMMSDESANRWEGKYLPRFYQKQFKDELKAWARAAKQLFGKKGAMQGIAGNSLKARGMFKDINVEELPAYEQNGWEVRDPGFDPADADQVTIWRDFTKQERSDMNEIRDSMFRFVMGYMRSQKDIALGRLYRHIARTIASRGPKDGYVQVPDTSVEGTTAKRYGELAGKWVPQEVLDHLSAADSSEMNEIFKLYLKGLSAWKEGRTVLNPVSHVNNVVSNVTMAHMAGVSYWDAHKYVGAVRDLVKKSPMIQEAKEAGLFGGTFNQADLLNNMPEQLKVMAGMSDSAVTKSAGHVWNAMSFFLRKPLQKAYENEDLFFRYLLYRDARQRGLEPDAAVEHAQEYIFTYDDLPKGARAIRDTVVPFFSWTYKAIPALARTALEYPWRFAAPAAVLWGANTAMYAIAGGGDGDDDDPWWEHLVRYVRDPEFRAAVHEMEEGERKDLPPWNRGSTAIGTPKVIRMGHDDVTNLPMFLDVSRLMPGGDMFDTENSAGGLPWFAPIEPGGPAVNVLFGMFGNLDYFTGKNITSEADTDAEAAEKRAAWMYQAMAPAIAPFGYHFNRSMNALAYGTDTTIDLGPVEYTGFGKDGLPVQPSLAALQTFGIKLRDVDLDQSKAIQDSQRQRLVRDIGSQISSLKRLRANGAISDEAFEDQMEKAREKKARLKQGLTVEGEEEE